MRFLRPVWLAAAAAMFCVIGGFPLPGQTPPAPQTPPQRNPFESVPATPQTQQPTAPTTPSPLQAPKPAPALPQATGQIITAIEFRGSRRVPADSLRATIMTKVGDFYNEETLRRDYMKLYNGGRFDDLRLETEQDAKGGIVIRFIVQERRVVSTINYQGMKSITVSEVLDRFKERKVSLTVDSPFDPNKIQRAAVVIKEYLSERGRQYATVDPQLEQVPPSSLKLTFLVNEGPKVKVGTINVTGNKAEKADWVIEGMKLLKPYGIPHSILFENVIAKTYDQNKLEYDMEKVRERYSDNGYFRAKIFEPTVNIAPRGGKGWRLPLIKMNKPGIYADITIPVEEGRLYRLHSVNFIGVKAFKEPNTVLLPIFRMRLGDVFSTEKLRKGIENMRKFYGKFGYYRFRSRAGLSASTTTATRST
jgi:outer membrane protein insertion porin family